MRGCLTVLVTGVAFLAILGWFVLAPLAGAVIATGLVASGLSGSGTTVEVSASPPYELLSLHADAVDIHSTDVTWRGLSASSLDLHLSRLDLGARTAAAVTGRLDGVSIPTAGGSTSVERMDLAGPSAAVKVLLTIDSQTATSLATHAVATAIGLDPTTVRLAAPDRVIVTVGDRQAVGTLTVAAGGEIVLTVPPFGHATIADPSADVPIVLGSVTVTPAGQLVLGGTLDPVALGLSH
jgi:hypothetical protein